MTFTLYRRCVHSTLSTSSRRTCRARFSRRISPWCPGGRMTPMKRTVMKISWNLWWTRPAWLVVKHASTQRFLRIPIFPRGMMVNDAVVSVFPGEPSQRMSRLNFCYDVFIYLHDVYSIYATFHLAKFCLPDVASLFPFPSFSIPRRFIRIEYLSRNWMNWNFAETPFSWTNMLSRRCFFKPAQVASSDISYFKQVS